MLVKVGLLLALIGLGASTASGRFRDCAGRADDGTPGEAGVVLRRTLRSEIGLSRRARSHGRALRLRARQGRRQRSRADHEHVGPAQLSLDVDPARPGANVIHIYLFDPKSGAQYDKAKQLTVTAELPSKGIGPLDLTRSTRPGSLHDPVRGARRARDLDAPPDGARLHFDEFERAVKVRIR